MDTRLLLEIVLFPSCGRKGTGMGAGGGGKRVQVGTDGAAWPRPGARGASDMAGGGDVGRGLLHGQGPGGCVAAHTPLRCPRGSVSAVVKSQYESPTYGRWRARALTHTRAVPLLPPAPRRPCTPPPAHPSCHATPSPSPHPSAAVTCLAATAGHALLLPNQAIPKPLPSPTPPASPRPSGGSQGDIYQIKATVEELNALYQVGGWRARWVEEQRRAAGREAEEVEAGWRGAGAGAWEAVGWRCAQTGEGTVLASVQALPSIKVR